MQEKLTRMGTVDCSMPSGCSDISWASGWDLGATAVLTCATSPARLGLRTSEKKNKKKKCVFSKKDAIYERLVSGVLKLLVLVISSQTD